MVLQPSLLLLSCPVCFTQCPQSFQLLSCKCAGKILILWSFIISQDKGQIMRMFHSDGSSGLVTSHHHPVGFVGQLLELLSSSLRLKCSGDSSSFVCPSRSTAKLSCANCQVNVILQTPTAKLNCPLNRRFFRSSQLDSQ